ncbi:hypothetical protein OF001_U50030 [Pseudomonas sp. OF001]|nr:hypothetical protein OF001_U50030 [Pseudomonas sp. OF001]
MRVVRSTDLVEREKRWHWCFDLSQVSLKREGQRDVDS